MIARIAARTASHNEISIFPQKREGNADGCLTA
jgi:hypothetical protein